MIAHVSMPADDCAHVARTLAAMMEGGALRFPPGGPDAWNAWSRSNDFQIVVTPRGQLILEGPEEQTWGRGSDGKSPARAAETHFAMAVERSATEVVAIAEKAGWRARVCNRGGMFDLVEVWVEGAYLVEVLDPAQMADYRRSMTVAGWQKAFGLG